VKVFVKLRYRADRIAAWAENYHRRGEVEVVSIQCPMCHMWLDPELWNPLGCICFSCTEDIRSVLGRPVRKPIHFHRSRAERIRIAGVN
jgi:hypothetical protein